MNPEDHYRQKDMKKDTASQPSDGTATDFVQSVPMYYNSGSGSSESVIDEMQKDARIQLEEVAPAKMAKLIKEAVATGTKRVLVSGGDGTIALAASILAGTTTELAIVPSGTLNHFAQRTGIPVNVHEAINVALDCKAHPVDVGYVNDSLFLNTSSVGAYSVFVRSRNYLESRMHYLTASIIAGLRRLFKFRLVRVRLANKQLRTPLVFIGVGERELRLPLLGQAKEHGRSGLHFIAFDCHSKIEVFNLVIKAIFLGIDPMTKGSSVENKLVHDIELNFRHRKRKVTVALDGELRKFRAPLKYRFASGEIQVALPDDNIVTGQGRKSETVEVLTSK